MGEVIELKQVKKRRRRAGSFAWLWGVLLMIIMLALGFGLAQSSLFNIRTIEVEGISHLTREEVVELSGLTLGEHIYAANIDKAQNMIASNFWVQQTEVRRKLPSTIVITVTERVPAAAITTADGLYIVDSAGVLLMKQKLLDGLSVLAVSGISNIDKDTWLGTQIKNDALDDALALIRQMDEASAAVIAEIDVSDRQRIIAHTTYGVDIYLGDKSDFVNKYALAMKILQNESQKGLVESVDYIDVALPDQPVLSYLT